MIYLDYNATSPLSPSVKAAMEALGDGPLNPSSIHAAGRAAKKHLEDARAAIASSLSAFPNEVLFTSSATEANNMVLRGFAGTHALLVSSVEHASISKTASLLGGAVLPVDSNGVVKLEVLEQMLAALNERTSPSRGEVGASSAPGGGHLPQHEITPTRPAGDLPPEGGGKFRPALVSVMLANNETGVIQPIAEIARIAHAHGALVHTDAVQGLGKLPLDWGLLGVDMLTITGHKAGGPVGAAALLIRSDLPIKPLLTGGKQELGRRAGTDNVRAVVGLAQTVKDTAHCPDAAQWLEWREWLERELTAAAPDAVIFGTSGDAGAPLPAGEAGLLSVTKARFSNPGEGTFEQASSRPHPDLQPHHLSSNPDALPDLCAKRGGGGKSDLSQGRGAQASPPRLPNTLCITMPGVKSETQIMNFDLAGFAVSAGSACSSGRVAASATLLAMGVAPELAECALRISWGWATTRAEIEAFANAWKAMALRLAKQAPYQTALASGK